MTNTRSLNHHNSIEYQSAYSLWRRFLVTNPALSFDRAKEEFAALHPELHIEPRINKNCPICTKHFYHSEVYDLPWVTVCPLHGAILIIKCPECNSRWPGKLELKRRSCPFCSAKLPFNQIELDTLYSKMPNLTRIKSIQTMLHAYKKVPHGKLLPLQEAEWLSSSQITVSESNPLMPSISAALTKGSQQELHHSGVPLQKTYQFECNNLPTYSNDCRPRYIEKDELIEKSTIAKVRYKLATLIQFSLKHEPYSENVITIDDKHLLINSNIYFMAFSIWQDLMQSRHSGFTRRQNSGFSYIYNEVEFGVPLIPSVKRIVSFTKGVYDLNYDLFNTDQTYYSVEATYFVLNDGIVRLIYELELWNLFFNVLDFMNDLQLRLMNAKDGKYERPYFLSDDPRLLRNSCTIQLGIFENRKNSVSIIIPKQEFEYAVGGHDMSKYNPCDSMKLESRIPDSGLWIGYCYWRITKPM